MTKQRILFSVILILLGISSESAELQFGKVFASGMILQRGKPVPVWGTGTPGTEVQVTFKNQSVSGKVDSDGRWLLRLKPLADDGESAELSVHSGNDKKILRDVIVGEVWVCFSQSHIEMSLRGKIGELKGYDRKVISPETQKQLLEELEVIPRLTSADSQFRYCRVWLDSTISWFSLSPQTVLNWSIMGLELGLKLRRELQVPIGIINMARGCSSLESWLPEDAFTLPCLADEKKEIEPFRKFFRAYSEKKLSPQEISDGFTAYCKNPKRRQQSHLKNGEAEPKSYSWLWQHMRVVSPTGNYDNALRHFIPFAVRGLIWWQGETNYYDEPMAYDQKLAVLVRSCRQRWEEPELPFITILQGQRKQYLEYVDFFRTQQFQAADRLSDFWLVNNLETPSTEVHMIHPVHEKMRVGKDTAELLLSRFYGRPQLGSGPLLEMAEFRDGEAVFSFRHGRGLTTRNGCSPQGFELAGEDRKFHPAQAEIVDDKVIAVSSHVPEPRYGRFLWNSLATPELVNENDLAAFPFNTTLPVFQKNNSINSK